MTKSIETFLIDHPGSRLIIRETKSSQSKWSAAIVGNNTDILFGRSNCDYMIATGNTIDEAMIALDHLTGEY